MVKITVAGERSQLKSINPSDVSTMDDNDIIVVNRICANKQLMKIKISNTSEDNKAEEVLVRVIKKARKNERNRIGSISDVKMTVEEVKTAFGELNDLPSNALKVFSK